MVTVRRLKKPTRRQSCLHQGGNFCWCLLTVLGLYQLGHLIFWIDASTPSTTPLQPNIRTSRHQADARSVAKDLIDSDSEGGCKFMKPWQGASFFTANTIHELDLNQIEYINCGSLRCAFRIPADQNGVNRESYLTLKVTSLEAIADEDTGTKAEYYRRGRRDSVAMERLTKSPYIANIYANAGLSQVTEYSTGGNLHDLVKRARMGDENFHLTPLTKLKIAYQIASAVADMHQVDGRSEMTSLVHYDLCCHQFLFMGDGTWKLNDFHLSVFVEKDPVNGRPCKLHPTFANSLVKLRPPEEIAAVLRNGAVQLDAVDVYMMGNIFYYLHTYLWMFQDMSNNDAAKQVLTGKTSPIPSELLQSNNSAIHALQQAIYMAWHYKSETRPSSRDICDFLKDRLLLEGIDVTKGPLDIHIPKLPTNHRYTDSDFNNNFAYVRGQ